MGAMSSHRHGIDCIERTVGDAEQLLQARKCGGMVRGAAENGAHGQAGAPL